MSAYIVDKKHILYLVKAALSRTIAGHHSSFTWVHTDPTAPEGYIYNQLHAGDYERAAEVANMLWRENIASVSDRYPNESSATLPGTIERDFEVTVRDICGILWDTFNPVQVLKACDCYDYQSCEHDGWKVSEAHTFIDALRHAAWHALPGYEDAEWGAPKTMAQKQAEYRDKQRTAALS